MESVTNANQRDVLQMKAELDAKYLTPSQAADLVDDWTEHYVLKLMREKKLRHTASKKTVKRTTFEWVQEYLNSVIVEPTEQKGYEKRRTLGDLERFT